MHPSNYSLFPSFNADNHTDAIFKSDNKPVAVVNWMSLNQKSKFGRYRKDRSLGFQGITKIISLGLRTQPHSICWKK